jgi:hypothetical protein
MVDVYYLAYFSKGSKVAAGTAQITGIQDKADVIKLFRNYVSYSVCLGKKCVIVRERIALFFD